jgi:hypothetical protein
MGAFSDDIGHFYRWLKAHPANLVAAGIRAPEPFCELGEQVRRTCVYRKI